jgi:hypothetical protein
MLKETRIFFRLHRFGHEKIEVPKGAIFIRLAYDPDTWRLILFFINDQQSGDPFEERVVGWTNDPPNSQNIDRYLADFMHEQTHWYVYYAK